VLTPKNHLRPSSLAHLDVHQDLLQQSLGLLLQRLDIGADLRQRAQRLRLVEIAGEGDLLADLGGLFIDPGVGHMGQYLAAEEGLDATILQQWHLLGIAQLGVWLVLHNRREKGKL
jgi:hypothetical protein